MGLESYAKLAEIWGLFSGDRRSEEECLQSLAHRYGKKLLAAMSATGDMAASLAQKDFIVTAVDFECEMIREGLRRYGTLTNLSFVEADLCSLNLPDKDYDFAFVGTSSFHHFLEKSQRHQALYRICQHLRPGGGLVLELWYPSRDSWSSPWRVFQPFKNPADSTMRVWKRGKTEFDVLTKVVTITQEVFIQRKDRLDQFPHVFQMQLFDHKDLQKMIDEAGYTLVGEYGTYSLEPWTPESPTWIVELVKR